MRPSTRRYFALITSTLATIFLAGVVQADSSQIKAQQKPGQFEILEGAALQLRAQAPKNGQATGYLWSVAEGEGGKLMNEDTPDATFYAPKVAQDVQIYEVQLATTFADGKTTRASVLVRVHKRPDKTKQGKKVVYRNSGPWLGFGFGFGMGYLWDYPIYVPIIIPLPPNEVWPPDLQPPVEPQPFAEEDIAGLPAYLQPEDIYDMEDFSLLADQLPELNDLNVDSYDEIDSLDGADMAIDDSAATDMMIQGEVLEDPIYNDVPDSMMDDRMINDSMMEDSMMEDSMMDEPMMDDMMY